ncbi:flavin reductase family protein [Streptomyces pseudovenezuelae]|uniref:3-hydroxy-9,10-secoandrosta-1,3,5(10)-triene-9, 17-dione monooxygenase reductase component n=1 Tax=Streptomyces pseudovenezuelae TaxID=67350 RepID=A0ABT6LUM2_9ACTN|nr:flavin reductase family protein [Streptomyces pseudovenezuelae]MDH6219514.1 3-hydroxy-9,10-secoandrosta-1,3,5(10)-triene-9,17-dione monooxygenase reductase component [Streptomyces pseudovenezuelae]
MASQSEQVANLPGPRNIDPIEFRNVLGHLPTGVVVLAANAAGQPVGMAANSITSVSLVPPLIAVCAAHTSSTWPLIRHEQRFCVSVLASHHEQISRQFSRSGTDRFAGISWHHRDAGPALDDAIAWLDCELVTEHDAGDHTIAVARVLNLASAQDGRALVFFRGQYGRFEPTNLDLSRRENA